MKNKHAQALGSLGGKARLTTMTKEQRSAIAKKAVQARWRKHSAKNKFNNPVKYITGSTIHEGIDIITK